MLMSMWPFAIHEAERRWDHDSASLDKESCVIRVTQADAGATVSASSGSLAFNRDRCNMPCGFDELDFGVRRYPRFGGVEGKGPSTSPSF